MNDSDVDEFRAFVSRIAELPQEGDGETDECEGHVWENDDAWSTLYALIAEAREFTG